eukprot:COSAG02_NODE_1856_length_10648_cov_8.834581_5_plen_73_part_00
MLLSVSRLGRCAEHPNVRERQCKGFPSVQCKGVINNQTYLLVELGPSSCDTGHKGLMTGVKLSDMLANQNND